MAAPWFRFHSDALDNKRVQKLPDDLFKFWINCQCILARENAGASGKMPELDDCAFQLRMSVQDTKKELDRLVDYGLMKRKNETKCNENETKSETKSTVSQQKNETLFSEEKIDYFLINWGKKQYKSDTSTDRVKRFRQRSKTVSETPTEQIRSDTDTEQIQKAVLSRYDFEIFLKDDDREAIKKRFKGWDINFYIPQFNAFVKKQGEAPMNPVGAFIKYMEKCTKEKQP